MLRGVHWYLPLNPLLRVSRSLAAAFGGVTLLSVALAAAVTAGGCTERDSTPGPANQLTVASRTSVAIMLRNGREAPWPLPGTYVGDVIAVTGYDFAPVASDNEVTIAGVACPVLGYVELNAGHPFGPFGALYVEVRSEVPVGNTQVVEVWRPVTDAPGATPGPITLGAPATRVAPSAPTVVDVHRLAYATPAVGNVVHAVDLTVMPPAWIAPRDLAVTALPSALVMSPDGRFAIFANGADLQVTAVADGQTIMHAPGFFAGPVGPVALSPDGRTLAAGVFPAGAPPHVELADVAWINTMNFNVVATTGLLIPGVPPPPSPARIAVSLGGAAPGGLAFTSDGSKLYVTLSSGVIRVLRVSPQSIPTLSHEVGMPQGASPFGVALTPDDRLALVTDIASGLLIPVETSDGAMLPPLLAGTLPLRPLLTPDGAHLLVADAAGGTLRVFHTSTNSVGASQPTLTLGFSPGDGGVSPEGLGGATGTNTLVLIDGNRLRFVTVNTAGGGLALASVTTGPFPNGVRFLAVSPAR